MMEQGAAPAAAARNRGTRRPRVAVRPHYEGPPSVAGRGADEGGESLPDRGPTRAPSAPGSYGPGDRKAAVERREAPALPTMERGTRRIPAAPHGAPPPRHHAGAKKGNTAHPAPQRTRAMTRACFLIPPLQGEGRRATSAFTRVFDALWRAGGLSAMENPHPPLALLAAPLPRKRVRDKKKRVKGITPSPRTSARCWRARAWQRRRSVRRARVSRASA